PVRRLRIPLFVLAFAILGPVGVAAEPDRTPRFEPDVLPILNAHCLQCHGGVHQKHGLDLRTLPAVLKGGESGPAVVPGKPEESLLWKKLSTDAMPKTDNKVSAANKAIIRAELGRGEVLWGRDSCLPWTDGRQECLPHEACPVAQTRFPGVPPCVPRWPLSLWS